ncbi:MAG: isocitrate lyase/phosphoenolpyruvate mutase family protein [Acidobacteria bacterium]|nr:isocitrate lyase/phosphoenolpyruvate mutase family protein [Acidobacteriota bacterium]
MPKATLLRKLLLECHPALFAGAHNGLSAKLVESAGFDGIWASGFEISASFGLPDANLLSMSENLAVVRSINEATNLPVIADCDNGYGNAINVIRTVREYEKADIAGICIEDNLFPKRCSFYEGVRRELESLEEFSGKIRAAKQAQRHADFVVIARTEALIAGLGMEEALRRAHAYAQAGADLILAHSKAKDANEVVEFARRWNGCCPLVAIPTTYVSASADFLYQQGHRIVIFANQGIRTAVQAMRATFKELRHTGTSSTVEDRIAPLAEIYDLVKLADLQSQEAQFLSLTSARPRAIILAAARGFEKELGGLTRDRPKCLLSIHGKTLLQRQVEALRAVNIHDISVVRGYQGDKILLPELKYFENPRYEETHNLISLFCAEEWMKGAFIMVYDDILFEESILLKLLRSQADIAVVVDHKWHEDHQNGIQHPVSRPELVQTSHPPAHFYRFLPPENGNRVLRIGRMLSKDAADGEFVGLAYFSERGSELLRKTFHQLYPERRHLPFHEAQALEQATLADLLQYLIDQGHAVAAVGIYKGWMEVDTFEDYKEVWEKTQE